MTGKMIFLNSGGFSWLFHNCLFFILSSVLQLAHLICKLICYTDFLSFLTYFPFFSSTLWKVSLTRWVFSSCYYALIFHSSFISSRFFFPWSCFDLLHLKFSSCAQWYLAGSPKKWTLKVNCEEHSFFYWANCSSSYLIAKIYSIQVFSVGYLTFH